MWGIHSEICPSILDTPCILSVAIHHVSDVFFVLLTLCFLRFISAIIQLLNSGAYSLEFNLRGESEVEKNTGSTMRANDNLCNQGTPCDTERGIVCRNVRKHRWLLYAAMQCFPVRNESGVNFTFMLPCIVIDFFLNNQKGALIIPILFCYKTLHVSGIFCAHHHEFSTIHSALASFMQVSCDRFQAESGWFRPDYLKRNLG